MLNNKAFHADHINIPLSEIKISDHAASSKQTKD
jgi:hypothetical protein